MIKSSRIKVVVVAVFLFFLLIISAFAVTDKLYCKDLDDGIAMETYDTSSELKKKQNTSYIIRRAKSNTSASKSSSGDASLGSAIIKEGATVKGDVTVIFDGKDINVTTK